MTVHPVCHGAVTDAVDALGVPMTTPNASRALALFGALMASLDLYLAVFTFVHRPLTTDGVGETLQARITYANSLTSPRLFVWAGSNGRYSHRCETLSQITSLPCANLSAGHGRGPGYPAACL